MDWWLIGGQVGFHEVIIESPVHNFVLAKAPLAATTNLVSAWHLRGATHAAQLMKSPATPQPGHIVYFKNSGAGAGASLLHPHSQVLPLLSCHCSGMARWLQCQCAQMQ